jgi:TPR repeat protein
MSEIEFLSPVGAPQKYEPLYVSVLPGEDDVTAAFDPGAGAAATEALAVQGAPAAQFVLGHMLLSGHGVARDREAAYRWFCLAAKSGRADALNMVGRCHARGWGVPVDSAEAARCYRLAADKANAWAMFNLGELTLAGDGVERDRRAALSLFVRAARRGNAKAMNMIGHYREEGWHGEPRPAAAERWYHHAARRSCFRGQYNFARLLAVRGDIDSALPWLRTSCATAPPEFCRMIANPLLQHPDARLRAAGRDFAVRAASGA